jgi:hypothetical protein
MTHFFRCGETILIATLALLSSSVTASPPLGFTPLFNGEDFANWIVPTADGGHWRIAGGVIDYDALSQSSGDKCLWSAREYGDFVLMVDWRIKETPFINKSIPYILPDGTHAHDIRGAELRLALPDSDSGIFLRGDGRYQVPAKCTAFARIQKSPPSCVARSRH